MAKRRRAKLVYGDDAHYSREETKPFLAASALVQVVARKRQTASQKLEEAVAAWEKPGCQGLLHDVIELPTAELIAWLEAAAIGSACE